MKTEQCMTQTELAGRRRISEATLKRWRTEACGPVFLKLGNQARYRIQDVEAFEEVALRGSTKINGEVDQTAALRPTSQRLVATSPPVRPITIWLQTGPRKTGLQPPVASRQR